MTIRMIGIIFGFLWLCIVGGSYLWNSNHAYEDQEKNALVATRSFFDEIKLSREWNARHGGVYVPVTDKTQPNPYLNVPLRDIIVNDTLTLTKINPALMTREISELAKEKDGLQFHITSLDPLRPENKPTEKEKEFLQAFEEGEKEKGIFIKEGAKTFYFYMAPLYTEKACLKCHAKQGYEEGDIRGGISVTYPVTLAPLHLPLLLSHLFMGLLGLLGVIFATYKVNKSYFIMEKQSLYDALTNIPNRRSFRERIHREYKLSLREHKPLSVIMCDIDKFKNYNDTYGHSDGDECLKKVAQSIQSTLKRPADFCARYGGEEFMVLLPNTDAEGAKHIAERIRLDIEKMAIPHLNGFPLSIVTLSLGIATLGQSSSVTEEMLVKDADTALYYAKEHGRNQVTHFDSISDDAV